MAHSSTNPARLGLALAIALALAVLASPPARAESQAQSSPDSVLGAIVGVRTLVPESARTARGLGTIRRGSGVLIDNDGTILTIGFLVLEAVDAFIIPAGGGAIKAKVIAYDGESGFGLLKALEPLGVKPIRLGVSKGLKVQDRVLIAPHGGRAMVTPAVVVDRRDFPGSWEYLLEGAIFTAPLNPAHPGAALLGSDGRLLGIGYLAVGDVTRSGRPNPGNMFVPIDLLKPIVAELKAHGRVRGPARPWLGLFTEESGGRVFVIRVAPEGPGDQAGVKPGAVVLAVGGTKIEGHADFFRKVWAQGAAGTAVELTLLEGTEVREVTIVSANRYDWLRIKK